jgi:ABC-type uncharacterized transport system substrate-binding protein
MKAFAFAILGAFLATVTLTIPERAAAHPHVWVTVETEVELGPKNEIIGFKHRWSFDEFYTRFAIEGLDANGDGTYSKAELQPLADTNVEALKEFNYFTFPTVSGTKLEVGKPKDYYLEYKNKILTLYFTLPLQTPLPADQVRNFSFMVYDPGFYVALSFDRKNPVTIADGRSNCKAKVGDGRTTTEVPLSNVYGENIDPASNFGAQFAQKVTIDCKG